MYKLDLTNAGQVWIFDPRSVKRDRDLYRAIAKHRNGEMSSGVYDWRRAVKRAKNIKRSDKRSCSLFLGLWILPLKLPLVFGFNPQKSQSATEDSLISIKTPRPTKFWEWKEIIFSTTIYCNVLLNLLRTNFRPAEEFDSTLRVTVGSIWMEHWPNCTNFQPVKNSSGSAVWR